MSLVTVSPKEMWEYCIFGLLHFAYNHLFLGCLVGPEEDIPRKMEYMDFVCHAPSDYFHAKNAPYPLIKTEPELCFIWTGIGPEIRAAPSVDEIFGVKDNSETDTSTPLVSSCVKGTKDKDKEKDVKEKEKHRDKEEKRERVKLEVD